GEFVSTYRVNSYQVYQDFPAQDEKQHRAFRGLVAFTDKFLHSRSGLSGLQMVRALILGAAHAEGSADFPSADGGRGPQRGGGLAAGRVSADQFARRGPGFHRAAFPDQVSHLLFAIDHRDEAPPPVSQWLLLRSRAE